MTNSVVFEFSGGSGNLVYYDLYFPFLQMLHCSFVDSVCFSLSSNLLSFVTVPTIAEDYFLPDVIGHLRRQSGNEASE